MKYLVTCTLFATWLIEFLAEIASELGPLDCDCSASENDTALNGVEETAPIESCATPKCHGDKFHVVFESMFVAIVQKMEVVSEETSFC